MIITELLANLEEARLHTAPIKESQAKKALDKLDRALKDQGLFFFLPLFLNPLKGSSGGKVTPS